MWSVVVSAVLAALLFALIASVAQQQPEVGDESPKVRAALTRAAKTFIRTHDRRYSDGRGFHEYRRVFENNVVKVAIKERTTTQG